MSTLWAGAVFSGQRDLALQHAHEEALRQEALRQDAAKLRPTPPPGAGVWAEHLGRPPSGDRGDYFPGRPADAPEPTEYTVTAPGITGVPLGRSAVSSAEEAQAFTHLGIQACQSTLAAIAHAEHDSATAVVLLTQDIGNAIELGNERAGDAATMFLAAGAGANQQAAREAVELVSLAQQRMNESLAASIAAVASVEACRARLDDAQRAVLEAVQTAERLVW